MLKAPTTPAPLPPLSPLLSPTTPQKESAPKRRKVLVASSTWMTPDGRVRFSKKSCKPPRKFCGEYTESTEEHHMARARMVRRAYGAHALDEILVSVEQRGILDLIVLDPASSRREDASEPPAMVRYLVADDAFRVPGHPHPLGQADAVKALVELHPGLPEKRLGAEFWRCAWIEVSGQRARADSVIDCLLAMNQNRGAFGIQVAGGGGGGGSEGGSR